MVAAESPAGTGILLFGSKNTEVYENDIRNQPLPVIVASYLVMLGNEDKATANEVTHERNIEDGESQLGLSVNNENYKKDKNFDPYPYGIHLHDNTDDFGAFRKLFKSEIGTLIGFKYFLNPPDIIFDGHLKPGLKGKEILCIEENTNPKFLNADIPGKMSEISTDMSNFDCSTD